MRRALLLTLAGLASAVAAAAVTDAAPFEVNIATDLLRVTVSGGAASTCVSALAFSLTLAGEAGGWTPNLLAGGGSCGANASEAARTSATALQTAAGGAGTVWAPRGGVATAANATAVEVAGIQICDGAGAVLATETWALSVTDGTLTWAVSRTFAVAGVAVSDQMPALALQTSTGSYVPVAGSRRGRFEGAPAPDWRGDVQMPSFSYIDEALISNVTGAGYPVRGGTGLALLGDDAAGGARRLILSPTGVELLLGHDDCRFSFTRPVAIFVQSLALGAECAAGPAPGAGYAFAAGDAKANTLTLVFGAAQQQGHAFFDLQVPPASPAAFAAAQAAAAARAFTMPMGYINGNSPACETCLHEMCVFPQMQGLFRNEPPPTAAVRVGRHAVAPPVAVQAGLARFFEFALEHSVDASGKTAPRWSVDGGNDWSFGGITDQYPNFVLAAYFHALNTGDKATVRRWMPVVERIAQYMLREMLVNATGLFTNTFPDCNGTWGPPLGAGPPLADNWFDDVRFGWHDALIGLYAVESFRALGDLQLWLGDAGAANASYALHRRMVDAFNARYWSEEDGMYSDWIDVDGHPRHYFYTWLQFLAIEFGVPSPAQATAIMATAAAGMARIRATFNVTADQLWCAPTNLNTLNHSDLTCAFDGEDTFGHYENGACFPAHTGYEALALARQGDPDAAFARFEGAMRVFNATRLWSQRYNWLTSSQMGTDIPTENLMVVWGGLFASFGVRSTLLGGLVPVGRAAAALEGASWTLGVLGQPWTVRVEGGTPKVYPPAGAAAAAA